MQRNLGWLHPICRVPVFEYFSVREECASPAVTTLTVPAGVTADT